MNFWEASCEYILLKHYRNRLCPTKPALNDVEQRCKVLLQVMSLCTLTSSCIRVSTTFKLALLFLIQQQSLTFENSKGVTKQISKNKNGGTFPPDFGRVEIKGVPEWHFRTSEGPQFLIY
jgi:hypothetical protein